MKSRLERIIEKLPKQELSAQKVELGLIDDIKEEMKSANSGAISAIDLAFKAIPLAEKSLKLNKFLKKYEGLKNKGQDVVVKKSNSNNENSLGMYIESVQKKLPLK